MAERFVKQYGMPEYDATPLMQSKAMVAYFEAAAKAFVLPKQVFDALWSEGAEVDTIIDAKGLKQINDTDALEVMVEEVLAANLVQLNDLLKKMRGLHVQGSGTQAVHACRRCIKNSRSSLTTGRSWLRSAQAR